MKLTKIIGGLIYFSFLVVFCSGQEKKFSPQEQELIEVVKKLRNAMTTNDKAVIDSILTNENHGIFGPSVVNLMLATNKLSNPPSQAPLARPLSRELSDFKVSLAEESAVVMAKETIVMRYEGQTFTGRFQLTLFLIKKDGAWRVAAHQMFPLAYNSFPQSNLVNFDVLPLSEKVKDFGWKKIAEDKQGDGMLQYAGDGKTLSYFYEKETEMLWFKFELYDDIEKSHPAVSLAIDMDADQSTGYFWWGKNSNFKYDKVLNLGISEKLSDSKFRGFNGITSGTAAIDSNWLNEKKRNLTFHLNPQEKAYYLGVKSADLGIKSNKINIVGSVGANSQWNDDIGEGFTTIEIPTVGS